METTNLGPRPHYIQPDSVEVAIEKTADEYKVVAKGTLFVPADADGIEDRGGRCNVAHIMFATWNLVHAAISELRSKHGVSLTSPLVTEIEASITKRIYAGQPYNIQVDAQVPSEHSDRGISGSVRAQISHPTNGLVATINTTGKILNPDPTFGR